MSILAFGTSLAELTPGILPDVGSTATTTAAQIAPDVDEGVTSQSSAPGTPHRLAFAAASDIWFSAYLYAGSTSSGVVALIFSSGGTDLFRAISGSGTTLRLEYWNGSAWVAAFTAATAMAAATRFRFDVHIKIADSGGVLELYTNGSLIGSFTGDTLLTAATTLDKVTLLGLSNGSATQTWSAVMVADEDTRPITYIGKRAIGAGGVSQWSGSYADIDETGFSDSDLIRSGTAEQVSTFIKNALPATYATGYSVIGIGVSARACKGASGPQNLQLAARSGSSNGFSASKALATSFAPKQDVFTQNPATSAAWTYAEADAAQIGVKSVA